MGRGVADDLQPLLVARGNDAQLGVFLNAMAGIHQPAVDLAGKGGLRQPRPNGRRDLMHCYGTGKLFPAPVWKCYFNHGYNSSLWQARNVLNACREPTARPARSEEHTSELQSRG